MSLFKKKVERKDYRTGEPYEDEVLSLPRIVAASVAGVFALFVVRTALDEYAPPEAVRILPEVANIVFDHQRYC